MLPLLLNVPSVFALAPNSIQQNKLIRQEACFIENAIMSQTDEKLHALNAQTYRSSLRDHIGMHKERDPG